MTPSGLFQVDVAADLADLEAGRQFGQPVLVLWSARRPPRFYSDPLEVWRRWAPAVRGRRIDASHFMAEDRPEAVAHELLTFLNPDDQKV
jgi:haloacetate dehalogenase